MGGNSSCCSNKDADKHEATEAMSKDLPGTSSDYNAEVVSKMPGRSPAGPAATAGGAGKGTEFKITVDKTTGTRLGVDVDHQDGCTLLIDAVTGGLIEKWNAENASQAVRQGDRIVEVNGHRGDVLQLVDECKKNKVLEMTIRRG